MGEGGGGREETSDPQATPHPTYFYLTPTFYFYYISSEPFAGIWLFLGFALVGMIPLEVTGCSRFSGFSGFSNVPIDASVIHLIQAP